MFREGTRTMASTKAKVNYAFTGPFILKTFSCARILC